MQKTNKLDEIDAKILQTLLKDSRTSYTAIAKNCNLSVTAVKRRHERLKKIGVINDEIMLVNPYSLGFKCIVDLGIITTVENEQEVIQFLNSKPYICGASGNFGRYNVHAFIVLSDTEKLPSIIAEIETNPRVLIIDSLIWAEPVNMDHPENLIIKPLKEAQTGYKPLEVNQNTEDLDETDKQITALLSQNARKPFREIAKQLNISPKNVIYRYNRLKGKGVLTKTTISIDLNKIGYLALAHVFIKVSNRSKIQQIVDKILRIPNLIVAIRLIGPYDVRALVAIENFEDLFEVIENFRKIRGIEKADTYLYRAFCKWPLNLFAPLLWTKGQIHPFLQETQVQTEEQQQ